MAEGTGRRLRITLRWIQIEDNMEVPWDDEGEFRFGARVTTGDRTQETLIPEYGHWSISDHPGRNRVEGIDTVLFEGEPGDSLVVEVTAFEIDRMSDDDVLTPYRREYRGDPSAWVGRRQPRDEDRGDPEGMVDWSLAYDIEVV